MVTETRIKIRIRREVIIRRRLEMGLKQTNIAALIGVLRSEIWRAENLGIGTPRVIKGLAGVLGLDTKDFVDIDLRDLDPD